MAEWDKRTRELKKKKMLQKQQARDRGEETGCDDNDDDDDKFDEVVADVDWDVLEGEDSLTGTQLSTQGPFPFHVGGSESVRLAEAGQTIGPSSGPVGAGGSAASPGVPAEDRWMGGGGSVVAPELIGPGRPAATPEVPIERGGSAATPSEIREMSPPTREQGAGSKRSCPDELIRGPGVRPQNVPTAQRRQSRSLTPLFSPLFILPF